MPYLISENTSCPDWAVVKEDGEVIACHGTKQSAIDQALAISLSEGTEYLGEMENRDEPAPPEDQIEGSDKNAPGSAGGAGGDIELSEQTETALRNKVATHNEEMAADNKPDYTRTTYGQLAAVFRRGAGAFSTSHRPGMTRNQWAMARVNSYLYLLANGRPKNAAYITDNDLLPEGHPKSTRSVRDLPDNYRPALAEDVPEGRACGNCYFYNEARVSPEGDKAWCDKWEEFVDGGYYCNAWEPIMEERNVDLTPPAYFRASARRGLQWVEEGHAGDGLLDRTIREARAMAEGNVTEDKWVRLSAFLARQISNFDAPAASVTSEDYPSPGVVAIALWGGGGTRRSAQRALDYAQGVVARLNAENEGRTKGDAMSKLETREFEIDLELREEGDEMSLVGYAALFNSRSENLGGFTETIAPGAFSRSLKSRNDVKLLWNHDSSAVLGSSRSGTLRLYEDERGLRVEASLPNTTHGRDAKELIKRGDVTGFSFGFSIPGRGGDEWNAEGTERTLKSVRLHEVSLTPFPAYQGTNGTASVRGLDKIALRAEVNADDLADALLKVEQGEEITNDDRALLTKVIDTLSPIAEAKPVEDDGLLQLKKLKAELLLKGI